MEHTAGTIPRLSALLILEPQQLQAFHIRLHPLLTVVDVFIKLTNQLLAQRLQLALVYVLGEVCIKVFASLFLGHEVNLNVPHTDTDVVWVFNLDL